MEYRDLVDFYKGKRVLVTGHTGFKGTWLCKVLTMMGADVYGYALEPSITPNIFTLLRGNSWVKSEINDIRDYQKLESYMNEINPELVFHLAAQPIVRESYRIPRETYEINVMGTVNILECIRKNSCTKGFLNVTTDKVYENEDLCNHPFKENEKLDGYDPYSNSKSCSELVTHSFKKSFFSHEDSAAISTSRAGNVIGGGDFSKDRIIPDCVRNTIKNESIEIRNPFSIRPYQHVLEPISVYLMIMMMQTKDKRFEGYYNVGPDEDDCISTGKLADFFVEYWGENASWSDVKQENAPHEAEYLKLDCTKLKTTFCWKPVWHINDAIDATVRWYKVWHENGNCDKETERQIMEYFSQFRFEVSSESLKPV